MNEYTKFLAHICLAAAVGISGPLVIIAHVDKKTRIAHEKKMRGIYLAHVKVMDKLHAGGYSNASAGDMVSDFDFYCITQDLEK